MKKTVIVTLIVALLIGLTALILSQTGSEGNTKSQNTQLNEAHSGEIKLSGKNGFTFESQTLLTRLTGGSRLVSSWLFWTGLFLIALLMLFVGNMIVESKNLLVSILGILLSFAGGIILAGVVIALLLTFAFINIMLLVSILITLKNYFK